MTSFVSPLSRSFCFQRAFKGNERSVRTNLLRDRAQVKIHLPLEENYFLSLNHFYKQASTRIVLSVFSFSISVYLNQHRDRNSR